MSTFSEAIQAFLPVTTSEVQTKIDNDDTVLLFVGRATCPYCRKFAPKLSQVAQENQLEIAFLNSEDTNDLEAIQAFRTRYDMPTVPALLVAKNGKVRVMCDSSLSEADILAFIQA